MLKQSICVILARLLSSNLHYIINYCKCLGYFMSNYSTMIAQVLTFSNPVTLNEGQGHPNWYQTVKTRLVFYHTKFERNCSEGIQTQATTKGTFLKVFLAGFSPLNIVQTTSA